MEQVNVTSMEELNSTRQDKVGNQKTLAEMRGVDNAMLENVYKQGIEYYQQAQLEQANTYFTYLVMHQPWDGRFHMALGSVLHQQQQYASALSFYSYALCLDACDPRPCFRIAECMLALGDTAAAIDALQTAINQSDSDPKYAEIRQLSNELLEKLT